MKLLKKIQETLYIGQWCFSPVQSRHLGTSHRSPSHHQLPRGIFLNFINSLKSFPFQRLFWFWEKLEVTGHQIWAVGRVDSPGWFDVLAKNSARDMVDERVLCCDEAARHQLLIAVIIIIYCISQPMKNTEVVPC